MQPPINSETTKKKNFKSVCYPRSKFCKRLDAYGAQKQIVGGPATVEQWIYSSLILSSLCWTRESSISLENEAQLAKSGKLRIKDVTGKWSLSPGISVRPIRDSFFSLHMLTRQFFQVLL